MKEVIRRNGAWIGFFALVIILCIATSGGFISPRNLTNLIRQTSINGILAGGMTYVILTGGIDLSVGSLVALASIALGLTQLKLGWSAEPWGAWASLGVAVVVGTFLGLINGGLIAALRIPPFVITLAMMVIARGFAMIFSGGESISPMGDDFLNLSTADLPMGLSCAALGVVVVVLLAGAFLVRGLKRIDFIFPILALSLFSYGFIAYHGIPILAVFLIAVLGGLGFMLARTSFGRGVFAMGSNERAAFWAGVPISRVTVGVYALMGALAGLAGALLTSRLNSADPNSGQMFELDAIAAVVIGGTSLKGGQGSLMGSLTGALTIASLNNGMDLLGVPSFYQMVMKGVIIVCAVAVDRRQRAS
jgi:D-xylose transport system permease protein